MKKLGWTICLFLITVSVNAATEYTRSALMESLKTAQTPEAAKDIFSDYVKSAPDLEFAQDIYRMWSSNDAEAAQQTLDAMRSDQQFAGRLAYFEGAGIDDVLERIDYSRKLIAKNPDMFEAYALMFDTYTNLLFKKPLDDERRQSGRETSTDTIVLLEKGFPQDNDKMVQIRDWKNKGLYRIPALKYMAYYGMYKKHYDDALMFFKEGEALNADWVDYSHMAVAAVRMKQLDLARDYIGKFADLWIQRGMVQEEHRKDLTDRVTIYALAGGGAYDEAIKEMQSREGAMESPDTLYNLGCLYSRKGDPDQAFQTLDTAISKGFNDMELLDGDPDLAALRGDSRWDALRAKVRTAWEKGASDRKKAALEQKIEKDAPLWELKDPDGQMHRLSDYANKKVVILDFWATWCGPCMMAMPKLNEWTTQQKPENVEVFSINTWERQPDRAKKLFADKKFAMKLLMNGDETGKAYGLQGIPYICVIDKAGKIRYEMKGYSPDLEQNLTYWVNDLLQ